MGVIAHRDGTSNDERFTAIAIYFCLFSGRREKELLCVVEDIAAVGALKVMVQISCTGLS
jgi:hypothetical protein